MGEPAPVVTEEMDSAQSWATKFWSLALLAGLVGVITAFIWRDEARQHLLAARPDAAQAELLRAVAMLYGAALGSVVATTVLTAILVPRLGRRGLATRIGLTVVLALQAGLAPTVTSVLSAPGNHGWVVTGCLVAQVVFGVLGTVAMWIPLRWLRHRP